MALPSRYVKGFHQEFVVNARLVGHPQVTAANTGTPRIEHHFRNCGDRDAADFSVPLACSHSSADTAPIYSVEMDKDKILAEAKADPQSGKRGRTNSTCCVSWGFWPSLIHSAGG